MSAQIIHISEGTLRLTVSCKANVFHTGASDTALNYQPQREWQTPDPNGKKIYRPQEPLNMNPCLAVTFYGSSGPLYLTVWEK